MAQDSYINIRTPMLPESVCVW